MGDLRDDVEADDVAAGVIGMLTATAAPAGQPRTARLLDLLMDGLRPPDRRDSSEGLPTSATDVG